MVLSDVNKINEIIDFGTGGMLACMVLLLPKLLWGAPNVFLVLRKLDLRLRSSSKKEDPDGYDK